METYLDAYIEVNHVAIEGIPSEYYWDLLGSDRLAWANSTPNVDRLIPNLLTHVEVEPDDDVLELNAESINEIKNNLRRS